MNKRGMGVLGVVIIVVAVVLAVGFLSYNIIVGDGGFSPRQGSLNIVEEKEDGSLIGETSNFIDVLEQISTEGFEQEQDGWIVTLNTGSVAAKKVELDKTAGSTRQALNQHRNLIKQEQTSFASKFSDISANGRITGSIQNVGNYVFLDSRVSKDELKKLKALPEVEKISPNIIMELALDDSVPLTNADDVWYLNKNRGYCNPKLGRITGRIAAEPDVSVGPEPCLTGRGTVIGILDSGVDYTHQDLGGCSTIEDCPKYKYWYDFVNLDNDPMDDHGHGTHVASTAAGNGKLLGVAPEAKIAAYKVCFPGGCYPNDIISGIDRSTDPNEDGDFSDHLDVISISLVSLLTGNPDDSVSLAVDRAVDLGVIAVIAAGNKGPSLVTLKSPGSARKAISVGATCKPEDIGIDDKCDTDIRSSSSRGPSIISQLKPDVVAPGVNICAARWEGYLPGGMCLDGEHIAFSGTSMATPHVSGVAALLKQAHPNWKPEEIKMLIKKTANFYDEIDETSNSYSPLAQGRGLVDALAAIQYQENPPIIRTELLGEGEFPVYIWNGQAFPFYYEVENEEPGEIIISRGVLNDINFNDIEWQVEQSFSFAPPFISGAFNVIEVISEDNYGEVYRLEFISESGESYYEDNMIFIRPPNMLEGWPLEFESGLNCLLVGVDSGILRSQDTEDVKTRFLNGFCPLTDSYLYDYMGENPVTVPRTTEYYAGVREALYMDLDGDGINELIHDNRVYDNQLNEILTLGDRIDYGSPIVDDVNLDGNLDIIQISSEYQSCNLLITDSVTGVQEEFTFCARVGGLITLSGASAAVGDLDGDGFKEIVSNKLDVISFTGNGYETKPYSIEETSFSRVPSIVMGDIDLNGINEVVIFDTDNGGDKIYLYIFEMGIIKHMGVIDSEVPGDTDIERGNFVLGDLVGDENLELLISVPEKIWMLDSEANLIKEIEFDFSEEYVYQGAFTYDVDQDGVLEVLRTLDNLFIFDNNLDLIDTRDIFDIGPYGCKGNWPFFTDLNKDGSLDLLTNTVGMMFCDSISTIYAEDLGIPYVESEEYWINPGYDEGNTRCYMCD